MKNFSTKNVIKLDLTLLYTERHETYEKLVALVEHLCDRHSLELLGRGTSAEQADFDLQSNSLSLSVVPFLQDLRRLAFGVFTVNIEEVKETSFNVL